MSEKGGHRFRRVYGPPAKGRRSVADLPDMHAYFASDPQAINTIYRFIRLDPLAQALSRLLVPQFNPFRDLDKYQAQYRAGGGE